MFRKLTQIFWFHFAHVFKTLPPFETFHISVKDSKAFPKQFPEQICCSVRETQESSPLRGAVSKCVNRNCSPDSQSANFYLEQPSPGLHQS